MVHRIRHHDLLAAGTMEELPVAVATHICRMIPPDLKQKGASYFAMRASFEVKLVRHEGPLF